MAEPMYAEDAQLFELFLAPPTLDDEVSNNAVLLQLNEGQVFADLPTDMDDLLTASMSPHDTASSESAPSSPAHVAPESPAVSFEEEEEGEGEGEDAAEPVPQAGKGTKRKRKATSVITREEIEQLKAKGLPKELASLADEGPLSPEDERRFKKQRRLIKNRESAHLSRQRRKEYMGTLEEQVNMYALENEALRRQLDAMTEKQESISAELNFFRSLQPLSALSDLYDRFNAQRKQWTDGSTTKAAGVCLMVVLFSFGLFFRPANDVEIQDRRVYIGRVLHGLNDAGVTDSTDMHPPARHIFERFSLPAKVPVPDPTVKGTTAVHSVKSTFNDATMRAFGDLSGLVEEAEKNATPPVVPLQSQEHDAYFFCPAATAAFTLGRAETKSNPLVSISVPLSSVSNNYSVGDGSQYLQLECRVEDAVPYKLVAQQLTPAAA